jgi:hypothetical protein
MLWVTALAGLARFTWRRAGKILIAASDCAQVLLVKSWVSGFVRAKDDLQRLIALNGNFLFTLPWLISNQL